MDSLVWDDNGRLMEWRLYLLGNNFKTLVNRLFEYNAEGAMSAVQYVEILDGQEKNKVRIEFGSYDALLDANKIRVSYPDKPAKNCDGLLKFDGQCRFLLQKLWILEDTIGKSRVYESGSDSYTQYSFEFGTTTSIEKREFDEHGHLKSKRNKNAITRISTDRKGRVSKEKVEFLKDNMVDIKTVVKYKYNKKGLIEKSKTSRMPSKIASVFVEDYTYEYY